MTGVGNQGVEHNLLLATHFESRRLQPAGATACPAFFLFGCATASLRSIQAMYLTAAHAAYDQVAQQAEQLRVARTN